MWEQHPNYFHITIVTNPNESMLHIYCQNISLCQLYCYKKCLWNYWPNFFFLNGGGRVSVIANGGLSITRRKSDGTAASIWRRYWNIWTQYISTRGHLVSDSGSLKTILTMILQSWLNYNILEIYTRFLLFKQTVNCMCFGHLRLR